MKGHPGVFLYLLFTAASQASEREDVKCERDELLYTWWFPLAGKLLVEEHLPTLPRCPGRTEISYCFALGGHQSTLPALPLPPGTTCFDRLLPPYPNGGEAAKVCHPPPHDVLPSRRKEKALLGHPRHSLPCTGPALIVHIRHLQFHFLS